MLPSEVRTALEVVFDFCSYARDLGLGEQVLAKMDLPGEEFAEALEVKNSFFPFTKSQ